MTRPFRLGLTMAGAVSAGAYTAGVLDFLFEALAAWETARTIRSDIPDHAVQISVLTGTSAGAVCAALAAMLPATGHTPVTHPDDPARHNSLLYQTWVERLDGTTLLDISDITGNTIPALLNGQGLDRLTDQAVAQVQAALQAGQAPGWPRWLGDADTGTLPLYLCLTSLAGVSYRLTMQGNSSGQPGHLMRTHADFARFFMTDSADGLKWRADGWAMGYASSGAAGWQQLASTALASAAFPVGLPVRQVPQPLATYGLADWLAYNGLNDTVQPDWPAVPEGHPPVAPVAVRQLAVVDGGALNNEPFELARLFLSGHPDVHNPRSDREARQAVVMIDPFPDAPTADTALTGSGLPDVFGAALGMLGALRMHSRFKPRDLMLAADPAVYSRFLIAPVRAGQQAGETALAAAGLGGFAGFLHPALRAHDFFLGRRNCQQFLRNHLVIHRDNPLVAPWVARLSPSAMARYHPCRADPMTGALVTDTDHVQLIPLFGACDTALPSDAVPWPRLDFGREIRAPLEALLVRRCGMLLRASRGVLAGSSTGMRVWKRLFLRLAPRLLDREVAELLLKTMAADLRQRGICA
jgi:Patatin-like phospholipase